MKEFAEKYSMIIVENLLKLRKGDLLSINVEEIDMAFARLVANKATEITQNIVKIVITQDHKPFDYIEFEPTVPSAEVKAYAMLHIEHIKTKTIEGKALEISVDKEDFPAIQKLGHLAEPAISGRRISVVWCKAPVFDDNDLQWKELEDKLNSPIEKFDYRRQYLEQSDVRKLFFKSDNTDFSITAFDDGCIICGSDELSNGRKFISSLDYSKVKIGCEKNSIEGCFFAQGTCLGKHFDGTFRFENGNLVEYPEIKELKKFFEFDPNNAKAGYITLEDKNYHLFLGGSLVDTLDKESQQKQELPDFFNTSFYTLDLELDSKVSVEIENCQGQRKEYVRKGMILE